MRAARLHAIGEMLRLEEVPEPKVKHDEVIIQMKAAGICGSDLHILEGKTLLGDYPMTLGHENAGIVVEVGSNVKGFKTGDRVCVNYLVTCNQCRFCLTGKPSLCLHRKGIGVHRDGGFATYLAVPARNLIHLPNNVPFEIGAILTDAVATPYHAIKKRSGLKMGDTVAVYGVGGVGFHAIKLLKLAGASKIIAVDASESALQRALNAGATDVINALNHPVEEIKKITEIGTDLSFEFVGRMETISNAVASVRPGGRAVIVGHGAPKIELMAPGIFVRNEIEVVGSYSFETTEIKEIVDLISAERMNLSTSISKTISLDEINRGLEQLKSKSENIIRTVVMFD